MEKLVVVIMCQNAEKFIGMCLDSVKDSDAIVVCDGGSTDKTLDIISDFHSRRTIDEGNDTTDLIKNKYDQEDLAMNGKQRNFYLNYLKENHLGDWCLVLDSDEILEDFGIQKIKQSIQGAIPMLLSPRIHHFIGDLGHEDNTKDQHFAPNRLFCITNDLTYPEVEHPVLQGKAQSGFVDVHLWHLRECLGIFETNKKWKSNMKKSNIHSETQLRQWQRDMLFGTYPRKRVHYDQLPSTIRSNFEI